MSGIINQRGLNRSGTIGPAAPKQPAFSVYKSGNQNNIANADTITFDTERYDQGANFASNTFTAPVTGRYMMCVYIHAEAIDAAATYSEVDLITSNTDYSAAQYTGAGWAADPAHWMISFSILVDMDASDTAYVKWVQSGGSTQTDIANRSRFMGYLAC